MRLVLATLNPGKLEEFRELAAGLRGEILSLAAWPGLKPAAETGTSFAENALLKARQAARQTGLVALADDSGLEVDYLNGAPGVYSARFAGEPSDAAQNNTQLLRLLEGVPAESRTCRFRCVLAIVDPRPGGVETTVEGICEGVVATAPRGSGGFGYDPLFYLPEYGCTMAELPAGVKNKISHRARAFQQAIPILEKIDRAER